MQIIVFAAAAGRVLAGADFNGMGPSHPLIRLKPNDSTNSNRAAAAALKFLKTNAIHLLLLQSLF